MQPSSTQRRSESPIEETEAERGGRSSWGHKASHSRARTGTQSPDPESLLPTVHPAGVRCLQRPVRVPQCQASGRKQWETGAAHLRLRPACLVALQASGTALLPQEILGTCLLDEQMDEIIAGQDLYSCPPAPPWVMLACSCPLATELGQFLSPWESSSSPPSSWHFPEDSCAGCHVGTALA